MKRMLALVLCAALLLCGCGAKNAMGFSQGEAISRGPPPQRGGKISRPHTNLRGWFGNGANEFTNMHYYPNRRINSQKWVEKSKKNWL